MRKKKKCAGDNTTKKEMEKKWRDFLFFWWRGGGSCCQGGNVNRNFLYVFYISRGKIVWFQKTKKIPFFSLVFLFFDCPSPIDSVRLPSLWTQLRLCLSSTLKIWAEPFSLRTLMIFVRKNVEQLLPWPSSRRLHNFRKRDFNSFNFFSGLRGHQWWIRTKRGRGRGGEGRGLVRCVRFDLSLGEVWSVNFVELDLSPLTLDLWLKTLWN